MAEQTTTSEPRTREGIAPGRLSDRALFSHAAADEAAFSELVRRYREPLRRHATRYVGDADAEDVVQQALVNASLALRRDPERDIEPRPWLYKVTTNAAIDHRRARAARPLGDRIHEEPDYEMLGAPDSDDPHQVAAGREAVRSVVSQIQTLAPNQRRAATARFLEGRSHDEIAGELGVSKGAARELIHRARRNLREAIPALSPVTLIEKLRHGIGGLFAGSSAPAAKLVAGAAVVAVAGGGAAVVASPDGGGDERARAGAAAATPAAAVSEPSRAPAAGDDDGSVGADGKDEGEAGGRNEPRPPARSGQGSDAGAEAPAGTSHAATTPSADATPVPPVGSDPLQSTAEQLGVGEVTEQLPDADVSLPSEVSDVTDQVPVDPPDLPSVGDPLGGGS
jgi:RNA polymerase sigma factor (sigma-70 family)